MPDGSTVPSTEDTAQPEVVRATELDRIETDKIEDILRNVYNQYESKTESNKKINILGKLQ